MFANRAPSAASRSRFGVLSNGWPAQLIASQRWSSVRIKTTFGRAAVAPGSERRLDASKATPNATGPGKGVFFMRSEGSASILWDKRKGLRVPGSSAYA